jgi:hypothetical protein
MPLRLTIITLISGIGMAACSPSPQSATAVSRSPQGAPSGIRSDNGGGQRQLGDIPNVSFGQGGAIVSGVPASQGTSY